MGIDFEKLYLQICGMVQAELSEEDDDEDEKINAFREGTQCCELSKTAYSARLRIENRLGVEDDEDVLELVNAHEEMQKCVAQKVYEYLRDYNSL